jgi:hypothetical protein
MTKCFNDSMTQPLRSAMLQLPALETFFPPFFVVAFPRAAAGSDKLSSQ